MCGANSLRSSSPGHRVERTHGRKRPLSHRGSAHGAFLTVAAGPVRVAPTAIAARPNVFLRDAGQVFSVGHLTLGQQCRTYGPGPSVVPGAPGDVPGGAPADEGEGTCRSAQWRAPTQPAMRWGDLGAVGRYATILSKEGRAAASSRSLGIS